MCWKVVTAPALQAITTFRAAVYTVHIILDDPLFFPPRYMILYMHDTYSKPNHEYDQRLEYARGGER